MIEYTIKIDNILWQKPKHGAIVNCSVVEGDVPGEQKEVVRIPYSVFLDETILPGQWFRITGFFEEFKSKSQIAALEAVLVRPSGHHIVELLAGDPHRFPGIGKAYARKLYDNLGKRLYSLLEAGDAEELGSIMISLNIPSARNIAESMVSGWANLGIGEVISWLNNLPPSGRFGTKLGQRVCKCWGSDARERIEEDPYRLLSFFSTPPRFEWVAWKKVDELARKVFGIVQDDDRRLHGAVIESLYKAYDNKNTIVDRSTLLEKVAGRLGSKSLAREALERPYGTNSFLHNDEWYQARGVFLMEKEVSERIANILHFNQFNLFGEDSHNTASIDRGISEFETEEGYLLGPEQKRAVHVCLTNNLAVISGGAGTGKTSVLKCIYRIIKKSGGEISQMALAGRAARRIKEATGLPARTIADFVHDTEKVIKTNMTFVIDEASMMDLPTTFRILRQLPEGCRLILAGDAEQLPPIGPGLVFHVIAKQEPGIVPMVELTHVYRQEGESGIPAVGSAIRGCKDHRPTLPDLPSYSGLGRGVSVCQASTFDMPEVQKRIYRDLGANDPSADVRILSTISNDSPYGVAGINTALHHEYSRGRKRVLVYSEEQAPWKVPRQFAEGEPVIWKNNDWQRDLINGTLGVVEKAFNVPDEELADPGLNISGRIAFDTGVKDITVGDLDNMDLAYAISIHKSQGSQFKRVIVPINKFTRLDKTLIYTAVTRGVEQVVLVGDISVARDAVESGSTVDSRNVGLGHMLRLALGRAHG